MKKKSKMLGILVGAVVVFMVTAVCSTADIPLLGATEEAATSTPRATATPRATSTPRPTATATEIPIAGLNEWVDGHYFSVRAVNIDTAMDLDGEEPQEGRFLIVNMEWKANNLTIKHAIQGVDFELVDQNGERYSIAGMIYESDTFESFSDNAQFQKGKWRVSTVTGTHSDTYRLVYDIPDSAEGLHMWYADLPQIDLGME